MKNSRTLMCPLACALGLALIAQGCREDLGCPPGTIMVGDVCEDAPDMGVTPDASDDGGCVPSAYYPDLDGDGLGAGEAVSTCTAPEGYVDNADDCDDDCDVCGNGEELCDGEDNDCDGETDEAIEVVCGTNAGECSTGVQHCVGGVLGECEGGVMPAIAEVCEGSKDENCDGEVDEDCTCAAGETRQCGTDVGECSFGTQACTAAGVFGECEGAVVPTAELCNGLDDNCNGVEDDGNPGGGAVCGTDAGQCSPGRTACMQGELACMGGIRPMTEVCNGLDDDCDGVDDNGVTTTFYRDADSDTYGNPNLTMVACSAPVGYVANDQDCDDTCAACHPGGTEVCDERNNDCDALTDEGVATTYYQDSDSDSRGNPAVSVQACIAPLGYVTNSMDCNDACNVCWSGNPEVCDGFDNNCMGGVDEGVLTTFYRDADMDSRGNPAMSTTACTAPNGYVANADDCNDSCDTCWTGNAESCDAIDNNCTAGVDEGFACVQGSPQPCTTTCGTTGTGVCSAACLLPGPATCTPPPESCNAIDEDCDSVLDEGLIARVSQGGVSLGSDARLARSADGYVGVHRRGASTYAYRVDAEGEVRGDPDTYVSIETASVVSVDIDRISNTAWAVVSTIEGVGVSGRILGLNASANPTINDSESATDANASGVARIAANAVTDGFAIYQAGSAVRLARLDFIGAAPTPTTMPGAQPRAELGMDIAALGTVQLGYVAAWVTGASPQVQLALISSAGAITSQAALGAGSNPSIEVDDDGNVGVVYVGIDNLPRFHHLTAALMCLDGGGERSTCARTLGTRAVNAPSGGFVSRRTLDIAADGGEFWIAARVLEGEQVFRVSRSTTHDSIFRTVTDAATLFMSVAARDGRALVLRGSSAYTHDPFGCP